MLSKKGFTLAEVMVTVAIVGVMAALLIPAITNTAPAQNKVLCKKAYSTTEKIVSVLSNDSTNYPTTNQTVPDPNDSSNTIFRIFNNTSPSYSGQDKFCYLFMDQLNTVGSAACQGPGGGLKNGIATTSDGIKWSMYIPGGEFPVSYGDYSTKIIFDINGGSNPNCTADTQGGNYGLSVCSNGANIVKDACAKNPDTFIIGVRFDGKLQVGTTDACAAYILSNPMDNRQ